MEKKTNTLLDEKRIQIGIFSSPQPPHDVGGVHYPNRITEEVYRKLADLGVTIVYGLDEAIGGPKEEYVFQALDCAQKAGIKYFVRDLIPYEYISLGHREFRDWRTMSAQERAELDERYARSLRRYKDHPAFAGVLFGDEPGVDSFEGIAAGKRVFDRECPGKIFYVNNLPYNAQPEQMQYGACPDGVPACNDANLFTDRENAERYHYFITRFFETVKPQVYSYDSYPFFNLANVQTMIYMSLYELPQICHAASKKYDTPYWMFMQVGGLWEGSTARVTDYAEMLLQVNLAMAYGAKGIQLFPGCFPNGWIGDDVVDAGIFDVHNKETDQYYYLGIALKQVKACEKYLIDAELQCIRTAGKFNGLLPPEEELQKVEWNETIFRGELPPADSLLNDAETFPEVTATSQFLISKFDCKGRQLYYFVNNSIAVAANIQIKFAEKSKMTVVYKGKTKEIESGSLEFQRVAAGDGIMIVF